MRIYVAHPSKSFDYGRVLYGSIRRSSLKLLSRNFFEYSSGEELLDAIRKAIKSPGAHQDR